MQRLVPGGVVLSAILASALAGCREPESIRTDDTPRSEARTRRMDVEAVRGSLDHMFAAVVPDGKNAWFFKLVTPAAEAKRLGRLFDEFVASLELSSDGKTPSWKLPEGWQEKPGTEIRLATIEIPHEAAPLELTVTTLPMDEQWAPYLERNVNRWMGQLQTGPLPPEVVQKISRKIAAKNADATVFELVGVMDRKSAMPAGHPPVGPGASPTGAATSPASPQPAEASNEFTYKLPAGWQLGPGNAMRKATFVIPSDGGPVDLRVTTFGAHGMMADPLENARRWALELGMDAKDDAKLKSAMTDMKIDGLEGQYMEFVPPSASGQSEATLAAMAKRGEEVWFFKLKGDRGGVERQRDAFRAFLDSVKFTSN